MNLFIKKQTLHSSFLLKVILLYSILIFLTTCNKLKAQSNFGITLCGAEFGTQNLPGVLNKDYIYPTNTQVKYFNEKGADIIQLPFRWERLQRTLGGSLDTTEIGIISRFIDECRNHGIKVILIMQNYGRYKINGVEHIVGSPIVTQEYFKDFWKKIATVFNKKINIYAYGIMSEPHDMNGYSWFHSAQQAINGIREVDRHSTILVDGENYSNPTTWIQYNDLLKNLKDPLHKLIFNTHCYFDADFSGRYVQSYDNSGVDEWTGVRRLLPFVEWLKKNRLKGFVGEFGVPKNDDRWLAVMNNFLEFIEGNGLGGCYWAAGKWWKDYPLSIEPKNGVDQPQLLVYQKYLQGISNSSASINFAIYQRKSINIVSSR